MAMGFLVPLLCANLLLSSFENADLSQLQTMAAAYSIGSDGDEEELRNALKSYFSLAYQGSLEGELLSDSNAETDNKGYQLKIEKCDSISVNDGFMVLEGNVSLSFSTDDDKGKKLLGADRIVMDMDNRILTAIGNAVFKDASEDSSRQELLGEIVSYNWDTSDINLQGGDISSLRKNNEGNTVEFHATGSTVRYIGDEDVIVFENGTISTSKSDPYWGISSARTALLGGGDLFIFNAVLFLGRVPILWFPAFFYPGTRLIFNPAIGLASDRGMFLNTTTEIYGTFPISRGELKSSSSFAALLMSGDTGEMVADGIIYNPKSKDKDYGSVEQWASSSGSYFAILGDVYQKGGVFLGYKTVNNLAAKKIGIDSFGGVAMDFADSTKGIRYFEITSGKVNLDDIKLEFSIPFYSDRTAYKTYGNRLTSFSLDSILGSEQIFPSTASNISSFQWQLDVSASMPVKWAGHYLTEARIKQLKVLLDFEWDSVNEKFQIKSATLPSFSTSVKGTLVDISASHDVAASQRDRYSDNVAKKMLEELQSLKDGDSESATLPEVGLSLFLPQAVSGSSSYSDDFSIAYDWNQSFLNELKLFDGALNRKNLNYSTSGSLVISTNLGNRLFRLNNAIDPSFEHSDKENVTVETGKVVDKLEMAIPLLGLTYSLNWKIMSFVSEEQFKYFEWNSTNVSLHNLKLSLPIDAFTLSLSQTLPPTQQSLTPAVSFSNWGIKASISQKFDEKNGLKLAPTVLSSSLSFSRSLIFVSAAVNYDFSRIENGWDSFGFSQDFSWFFWKDGLCLSDQLKAEENFRIQSLDLRLSYRKNLIALGVQGEEKSNGSWMLKVKDLETVVNVSKLRFSFWRGRISSEISLDLDLVYDFLNKYASSLKAKLDFKFAIAEFLDLTFSVSSQNNGFYRYFDSDDKFRFSWMMEDLWRSFDFFNGGRKNTSFNLSSMSAELVHYMKDWNLHCKYNASVVLSDGSWVWEQTASFYVQWVAIPDIKLQREKEWETDN